MKNIFPIIFSLLLICCVSFATVTNTTHSVSYTCTGTTGPFTFSFPAYQSSDLSVIETSSIGANTTITNFSVTPVNNDLMNGGSITLYTACPSTYTLTITRDTSITQSQAFTDGMPALYSTFESGLDKLTMIALDYYSSQSGGGGSGANASGYYLVNQSTSAPTNAINLGALSTGLLYGSVSGGVWTPSVKSIGVDIEPYYAPLSIYGGISPSVSVQTLLGSSTILNFVSNLGLTIGTYTQAYSTNLTTFATIAPSSAIQTFLNESNVAGIKSFLQYYTSGDSASFSGLTDTGITGNAESCAYFDTSGVIHGTGTACGSSGGSGANSLGTYLVASSSNAPTNAVNLGALSSGVLYCTVSSSVCTPSIKSIGTDIQAYNANTVIGSGIQYYLPYWSSTNGLGVLASLGSAGQVLTSNGAGAIPSMQSIPTPAYATAAGSASTSTTQTAGDNSTKIATTAFVANAISVPTLTNIFNNMGADVALTSANTFYDGPTVPQGTTGTWFATGYVTIHSSGVHNFTIKLWDGANVYTSTFLTFGGTGTGQAAISAIIGNPIGNIRISVSSSGTGDKIANNASGLRADSYLAVIRIQ